MEVFHLGVEKLLFILNSSRPDLDKSVSYLMTIVLKTDVDDWGKLRRILKFFHCTLR